MFRFIISNSQRIFAKLCSINSIFSDNNSYHTNDSEPSTTSPVNEGLMKGFVKKILSFFSGSASCSDPTGPPTPATNNTKTDQPDQAELDIENAQKLIFNPEEGSHFDFVNRLLLKLNNTKVLKLLAYDGSYNATDALCSKVLHHYTEAKKTQYFGRSPRDFSSEGGEDIIKDIFAAHLQVKPEYKTITQVVNQTDSSLQEIFSYSSSSYPSVALDHTKTAVYILGNEG